MSILLSINIPTYNRSKYLHALLTSIGPDMAVLHDVVEVNILDNCSPDDTAEIISSMPWGFDCNYTRHEENIGPQANIHMAHRVGTGRYVWVMGDDDFLRPGQLSRIVETLRRDPGVLLMSYNRQTPDHRMIGSVRIGDQDFLTTHTSPEFNFGAIDNLIGFLSANIIRRDWIDRYPAEVYDQFDKWGEMAHAIIYYAAIIDGEKIAYLANEPLVQTVDNGYIRHDIWIYVCVRYCIGLPLELLRLGYDSKMVLPYFRHRLLRECFRRVLAEKYRGHPGLRVARNPEVRKGLGFYALLLLPVAAIPAPFIRIIYNTLRTKRK